MSKKKERTPIFILTKIRGSYPPFARPMYMLARMREVADPEIMVDKVSDQFYTSHSLRQLIELAERELFEAEGI